MEGHGVLGHGELAELAVPSMEAPKGRRKEKPREDRKGQRIWGLINIPLKAPGVDQG